MVEKKTNTNSRNNRNNNRKTYNCVKILQTKNRVF